MIALLLAALIGSSEADAGAAEAGAAEAGAAEAGADDRVEYRLWTWTSAEALPDLQAESRFRAEEQLRLDLRTPAGWRFDVLGAVRDRTLPASSVTGDLYRLSARQRWGALSLGLGRQVRHGAVGMQHLDGVVVDAGASRRVTVAGWAGRLWHPEAWPTGDTWVLGSELHVRPGDGRAVDTALGAEGRIEDGTPGLRVHGLASIRGVTGGRGALLVELDPLAESAPYPAGRASLSGGGGISADTDLKAAVRWEGLTSASEPAALTSPMEWLAGEGYAVFELTARVHDGPWAFGGTGGPTVRPDADDQLGGMGRVWASWQVADPLFVGVSGVGAMIGDSWLGGVLAESRVDAGRVGVDADLGLFRSQGIVGPTADVVEGRLRADAALVTGGTRGMHDLRLAASLGAGSDRLLASFLRGGLSLQGSFGNLREGQP